MPHEIDNNRAIYARKPAWHGLGVVKNDGWFSADEALAVLNPNSEPIRKGTVFVKVMLPNDLGEMEARFVEADDYSGNVRINPDTGAPQVLGVNGKDYGLVQLEDQFRFLDEVVGNIGGSHYETAGLLRLGKQAFVTIDTGAITLDADGIADRVQKYILGVNSWDGSLAFRVKMTNVRVECANLLAMALRGSSDKVVSGDWSTKHTRDIMNRTEAAKITLGLWTRYNDEWLVEADTMIHTPLSDDAFQRLVEGLFETDEKLGIKEKDTEAIAKVRTIYELSPTCERIHGTVWGGLQAVTEHSDWYAKVRGGKKSTAEESRFRRQLGETDKGMKDRAWERFFDYAQDNRRVVVGV